MNNNKKFKVGSLYKPKNTRLFSYQDCLSEDYLSINPKDIFLFLEANYFGSRGCHLYFLGPLGRKIVCYLYSVGDEAFARNFFESKEEEERNKEG